MERNYDEVIADMLIQLKGIEKGLVRLNERMDKADKRMDKVDKRMDLTIKRMVRAESRLELLDKKLDASIRTIGLVNKGLAESIRGQREFTGMQSKLNKYFIDYIRKNPL